MIKKLIHNILFTFTTISLLGTIIWSSKPVPNHLNATADLPIIYHQLISICSHPLVTKECKNEEIQAQNFKTNRLSVDNGKHVLMTAKGDPAPPFLE